MNIDVLQCTEKADRLIERIGRICYDSEHLIKEDSHKKFIKTLLDKGHDSVLEHGVITFHVSGVSRALTHQLVRHRIGCSYTQRSQRYCKEEGFGYVDIPIAEDNENAGGISEAYDAFMKSTRSMYKFLIGLGCKPEDARMVLPNACHTEITITMNFRALRHFAKLRCDKHAQWEIRYLAASMLELAYQNAPACFEDLYEKYVRNNEQE